MSKALRNYGQNRTDVHNQMSSNQIVNNTGGYVFQVSDETRLERFLILGTDGGTYYVTERDLTQQNVDWLIDLIKNNPSLVIETVHNVSVSGRAYRNSAAIFTIALGLNHAVEMKNDFVLLAPQIARTATMVFELAEYIKNLGGWGRSKRRAISGWFESKTPDELAFQAVKYRQRNGWTLRDLMRLSHPVGVDPMVGNFILGKPTRESQVPEILTGFADMQDNKTLPGVLDTLETYPNLPWETIPTQFLKSPEVWKKLFYNGQLKGQALVRNVTRLSKIDAFDDMVFAADYANALTDKEMIKKTRLHPMQYLLASVVYMSGQIDRTRSYWSSSRNRPWSINSKIAGALDAGFVNSFASIAPANKRTMLGIDVSGSMSFPALGVDLTAAECAAAMAVITSKSEPYTSTYGFANTLKDLGISDSDSLATVMEKTRNMNFGTTDPSLLISHAMTNKIAVDTFVIITDNEVNTGVHPSYALKRYRDTMGIPAKLVVAGVTATDFTIADPNDPGMLDVVGFDANAPKVIADFSRGF